MYGYSLLLRIGFFIPYYWFNLDKRKLSGIEKAYSMCKSFMHRPWTIPTSLNGWILGQMSIKFGLYEKYKIINTNKYRRYYLKWVQTLQESIHLWNGPTPKIIRKSWKIAMFLLILWRTTVILIFWLPSECLFIGNYMLSVERILFSPSILDLKYFHYQ